MLSFGLLWAVISYLSETRGLALTLAGITGIIVSIGVSLDSNIVFFEHMKEDIRNGRSPRSAYGTQPAHGRGHQDTCKQSPEVSGWQGAQGRGKLADSVVGWSRCLIELASKWFPGFGCLAQW